MRIGIDATTLFDQYSQRGIGSYSLELTKRLIQNKNHHWVLFGFNSLTDNLNRLGIKKSVNISFVNFGKTRNSNPLNPIYFRFSYLRKIRKQKLDLYFAPNLERGLPIGKVKTVLMMHDVIPYITGSYSQKNALINTLKGIFYRSNLAKARKADAIITNSDFTKRELVNKANFPEDKTTTIHLATSEQFKKENINTEQMDVRRTLMIYKIVKPYLLYYGGLEQNKNVSTLIDAFEKVSSRFPDLKLVIVGKEFKVGWDNRPTPMTASAKAIWDKILNLKLKRKIIVTGAVEGHHLPIILGNAQAFIHLSTYEGFGLSVLEAITAGVPTIAARKSSYPEVLGESVEFVNPEDVPNIQEAIMKVISDETYQAKLSKLGLLQAKKFNWDTTAQETLTALESVNEKVTKLKIAYVAPYFHPIKGGAEANCLALALASAKVGHEVHVFTSNTSTGELPKHELYKEIHIHRYNKINNQYYLGFYPGLLPALLRKKFNVIHAHGFGFIWHDFVLICKKILSPKTVFINTPHGPFMALTEYSKSQSILKATFTFIQKFYLHFLYKYIIAVNDSQYKWITKYGIKKERITFIPNGIAPELLKTEKTEDVVDSYGLNRKVCLTFLGRFEKYKGLQDIISAIEILRLEDKILNVKLIAMGNKGNYYDELQKKVEATNLSKQVELLITPSDKIRNKILQRSDIFITASQWEAFGIAMMEAMAKGNAVVSTRTEGSLLLLAEKENGYFFDYGDTRELARLLKNLITDKTELKAIQERNKKKAALYTWDAITDQYLRLLTEITKF